eukprot:s7177_g4.t2
MCPATTADICGTAFAKMSHRTLVTEPIILLGLATTVAEKLELAAAAPGRRVVLNPVEAWGSSRPKPEWLVVSLENYAAAALEGSEMASIFQEPALCAEDTSPDAISNLAEESSEKPPANTQEADSKFTKQTDQASTIGPEPLLAGVDTNGPWKGVLYGFWPALVLVLGMVVMLAILNARWALDGSEAHDGSYAFTTHVPEKLQPRSFSAMVVAKPSKMMGSFTSVRCDILANLRVLSVE